MRGARGARRWARLRVLAALVSLLAVPAAPAAVGADVIFHVPEVLVRHAAVPRPVGSGGGGGGGAGAGPAGAAAAARNDSEALRQQLYQYYVEHAISAADAKKMAALLRTEDLKWSLPGCGPCSQRDLEYCEAKVLADHCCCERHFVREPFPWLPHTCYIGAERCAPFAPSCAHYVRLRDCCCFKRMAVHWKAILSGSPQLLSGATLLMLAIVMLMSYL